MTGQRERLAFLRWMLPQINPAEKELCEAVSESIAELEEAKHQTESLVRLANKHGYLLTSWKSDTHRVLRNFATGEELEIEYLPT